MLANIMRGRIQSALTGRGVKSSSTVEYVGCSFEKLRKHLESQFEVGMSWENTDLIAVSNSTKSKHLGVVLFSRWLTPET